MVSYRIVFALFDESFGPYAAYFDSTDGLDKNTADRIAMHTLISSQGFHNARKDGESILALPDLNSVAFFYYFHLAIPQRRDTITPAVIAFVTTVDSQMSVYQSAPELSLKAKSLAKQLKESLETKWVKSTQIDKEAIRNIMLKCNEIGNISVPEISLDELVNKGNTGYLVRNIKEDLDSAIFGMITGKPVVVTGEQGEVELAIASLLTFSPHRKPKVIPWSTTVVMADLIGADRELIASYNTSILVDIDKGRVFRGRKNSFCEKLIKDIDGKPQKVAAYLINKRISWLISLVSAFSTIIKTDNKNKITDMLSTTDRDTLYLVAVLLEQSSPVMAEIIFTELGEKSMKGLI